MRARFSPLRGLFAALLGLLLVAPSASGYAGQVPATIVLTAPATPSTCVVPVVLRATVFDVNGQPVGDAAVSWHIVAGASGDRLASSTSTTDAAGTASVGLQLGCTTGQRTVQAIREGAFGQVVVSLGSAGLPVWVSGASHVGLARSGVFTATTKVASPGQYVTFRFAMGSAYAGRSVQLWTANRTSTSGWSAFSRVTSRFADAQGVVYYAVRSSTAAWIAVQARFAGTTLLRPVMSDAAGARWR